jgi:phosphate-selective porin
MEKRRAWLVVSFLIFITHTSVSFGGNGNSRQGIYFSSADSSLKMRLGGEINFDFLGYDEDEKSIPAAGTQENDFLIRRARVYLCGTLYSLLDFNIKSAFELEGPSIIDAYVVFHMPSGIDLQAGQMKMPFSEERLRSYSQQPFIERGLAYTLALRRTRGIYVSNEPGDRGIRLDLGIFSGETLNQSNTDDDFEYAGRVSLLIDRMIRKLPGTAALRGAVARGRRSPVRSAVNSFPGKTMNGLEFFTPVPVNGMRTRYEGDVEWRYKWLWVAGEGIDVEEERGHVEIELDTNGDGIGDESVIRSLKPLRGQGWMAYVLFMLTGENAGDCVVPARRWGALGLALRCSSVIFDSQEREIAASVPGSFGREVNATSQQLGRLSIDESVTDFYAGLNWYIKPGLFFQGAAVWQWFDRSSPFQTKDHSDVNYRCRIGMVF